MEIVKLFVGSCIRFFFFDVEDSPEQVARNISVDAIVFAHVVARVKAKNRPDAPKVISALE